MKNNPICRKISPITLYMKNIYLFLLFLPCLISCEEAVDPAVKALEDRQAAFTSFSPNFSIIELDTLPTFACEDATFGPHISEPYSDKLLSDSLVQAIFSPDLLQEAGFMRKDEAGNVSFAGDNEYYALGNFPFAEGLDAYLIGAFENESMYSSHLFLYDKNKQDFTGTHSLNFLFEGGAFSSSRQAWLHDIDGDAIRDVVYQINMSAENDLGEMEPMISDSMRAEVWTGSSFETQAIDDPAYLRQTLGAEAGSGGEVDVDVSDFF